VRQLILNGAIWIAVLAIPTTASAGQVEEYPTAWRLQNYVGGNSVVVYFATASGCTGGRLNFPGTATTADVDRFWSLVLTARVAIKKIGVFFSGSGTTCMIDSFYLTENS
jgi:hypothetical protein